MQIGLYEASDPERGSRAEVMLLMFIGSFRKQLATYTAAGYSRRGPPKNKKENRCFAGRKLTAKLSFFLLPQMPMPNWLESRLPRSRRRRTRQQQRKDLACHNYRMQQRHWAWLSAAKIQILMRCSWLQDGNTSRDPLLPEGTSHSLRAGPSPALEGDISCERNEQARY